MSLPPAIQDDTRLAAISLAESSWDDAARQELKTRMLGGMAIVVPRDEWMPKQLREAYECLAEVTRQKQSEETVKSRRISVALAELEAAKKEAGLQ